jgi:membrane peptidoglycan carboxypeptidase
MGPFVHRVLEPDGTWFEMTTGPGTPNWASIYSISPFFVHSVVAHEDGGFFSHHGFALWAIRDAVVRNLREGRYATGASTITMQLAKNLFLHREKTLVRKIQEVILTWWLEKALEKRDILELYLNVIEYGPSIYGIRQASWHYFGRDPSELTPAQSAFFATILPAPKRYYGQFDRGTISDSVATRMRNLLRRMHERGRIDADALAHGLAEIEHFRFRGEGDGRSTSGPTVGTAAPLPLGSSEDSEWELEQDAEWDRWDEEWMGGGE